jgi:hypothetical protein
MTRSSVKSMALSCLCALALFALTAAGQCFAQPAGQIRGVVLSPDGHPAGDARVTLFPTEGASPGRPPTATTDPTGRFVLRGVPAGRYRVTASKLAAGYGDPIWTLFSSDQAATPSVGIGAGRGNAEVVVRLPPKGAWLAGRIADLRTGLAVPTAGIGLYHSDSPQEYAGTGPDRRGWFRVLVPSDKSFRMSVSAKGYATWYYGRDGTQAGAQPIRMAPGTTKEIIVRLHPAKSK